VTVAMMAAAAVAEVKSSSVWPLKVQRTEERLLARNKGTVFFHLISDSQNMLLLGLARSFMLGGRGRGG